MGAVVAAAVTVLGSAALALLAVVVVWGGPPGTTALVALLTFAMAMTVGVSASEPLTRRAAATAYGEGGLVSGPDGALPAGRSAGAAAGPSGDRRPQWSSDRRPQWSSDDWAAPGGTALGEPGRCFGCVQVQEVTEVGVLARGGVRVPVRVCRFCLAHLDAWHAAQAPVSGVPCGTAEPELVW